MQRRTTSVCVQHFDFYTLPKSNLTNANILCLVRFVSSRNKFVQLLIRAWNIFSRTARTLKFNVIVRTITTTLPQFYWIHFKILQY